jgi:60 kDa SS-A/Ro ribonucleoprotein
MARTNLASKSTPIYTHEGAIATRINPDLQLRRLTLSTMLFEDQFYVDGKTIAEAILEATKNVKPEKIAALAIECREAQKLRHMPLFLVRELARRKDIDAGLVSETLAAVIQRADELAEFLALYWKDQPGKKTLSAQVKKGLALAFQKFSAYDLAKYNRDNAVKLRDVLFLCHAKPKNDEQAAIWKQLVDGTLPAPETWEVKLSAGEGKKSEEQKKEHWTALLAENKLGALALLRNLRNMQEAGVPMDAIRAGLLKIKVDRVLPFRFISAARYAPKLETELEQAMLKCLNLQEKLPGKTVLVIDVSGSMGGMISGKSELQRFDAAGALAILLREVCDEVAVYCTAGSDHSRIHKTELVPARRGFALRDLVKKGYDTLGGGGIFLVQCMEYIYQREKNASRVIVMTDEQDCDIDPAKAPAKANTFGKENYLINVASDHNGIGYGKWTHIDGWSEACIDFIREIERVKP